MRISSDTADSGYHPHFNYVRIWLEGAERSNVITADEEGRFAITYRLDEFGVPVRDAKTGEPLTDRFYGAVRIECAPWLREAMESPEEPDSLSVAIYGMVTPTP
jgi:hypothetical protein